MPTIHFKDGTSMPAKYSSAARLRATMEGELEFKDEKQRKFAETVASVDFSDMKRPRQIAPKQLTDTERLVRKKTLEGIKENQSMSGIEKFRAVREALSN